MVRACKEKYFIEELNIHLQRILYWHDVQKIAQVKHVENHEKKCLNLWILEHSEGESHKDQSSNQEDKAVSQSESGISFATRIHRPNLLFDAWVIDVINVFVNHESKKERKECEENDHRNSNITLGFVYLLDGPFSVDDGNCSSHLKF